MFDHFVKSVLKGLTNPTPEKEATESESNSSTNTDGRHFHAIDTQQQQHNSLNFHTFKMEKFVKIFLWLYYHFVDKG